MRFISQYPNNMEVLLYTVLTLCVLGILAALILYFVAQKFKVEEDPRIDEVEKMLPGANCGGCGFAGCRGLADALVKRTDISSLFCPVGGAEVMKTVAAYLGKAAPEKEPQVATVRCGGSCEKRPRINAYDGVTSCAVAASLYGGETGCTYGCLGYGDCVTVCNFDAIAINPETRLPEVDFDKCTACGACVKACPKSIIELRKKWPKQRAVYVACMSKDKGAVVMKACKAGCIGCGKCEKVCPFGAITIQNNLAFIDSWKCKLCRKCVNECPTGAIRLVGMEPLPKEPKAAPASKQTSAAGEKPASEEKKTEKNRILIRTIKPKTNAMKTFPRGGVHPSDNKLSRAEAVEAMALTRLWGMVPFGPAAYRCAGGCEVAKGRQGEGGRVDRRSRRFRVGQYPCARVGHRDGGGYAAQRAGNPPDDDYDPSRGG